MTHAVQDHPPFAGHSPAQDRPLGGYTVLMATFSGICAGFGAWLHLSGRELPERVAASDLALGAVAVHKASRLVARARVASTLRAPFTTFQDDAGPSEVDEAARGRGLRRAIGELLVCPHCLDMWIGAGFLGGLIAAPRATRWIASAFALPAGADALQLVEHRAQEA
jgi:Protein of unknown function (DUF1360)